MSTVPDYVLAMEPADLKWFRTHVGTNRCFPAHLQAEHRSCPVWIGYRGRFSRRFPKPSYDIWFGEDRPFAGHARLHLNAAYRDPSQLRGRLALATFAELGVPAPLAWPAMLTLNGEPMGLYTVIESLDAAWLGRRGLPDGAIYYGVGGEGHFGLINPKTGQTKRYLALGYEKCHPWDESFHDVEELILQIVMPDQAEFDATIEQIIDVELFLRWLIGLVFMSHTDGLIHNYALYRCQGGLWQISPWDCDGTWGRCPDGSRLPFDHMPLVGGGGNYLTARLLTSRRWRQRYSALWEELLATVLHPAQVAARMEALFAYVRTALLRDTRKPYRNRTVLCEPALIRQYVTERTQFLRRELARPWQ